MLCEFFMRANGRRDACAVGLCPTTGDLASVSTSGKGIQSATTQQKESKWLLSRMYDSLGGSLTSLLGQ